MQNLIHGDLARHILYLRPAEGVGSSQLGTLHQGQLRHHGVPDVLPHPGIGLLKLYFIEEPALEGRVEIALQVGGGDEDAFQALHLLQDDVLNGILHLIDRILRPLLA